jgi:hypothetical protein
MSQKQICPPQSWLRFGVAVRHGWGGFFHIIEPMKKTTLKPGQFLDERAKAMGREECRRMTSETDAKVRAALDALNEEENDGTVPLLVHIELTTGEWAVIRAVANAERTHIDRIVNQLLTGSFPGSRPAIEPLQKHFADYVQQKKKEADIVY